MLYSPWAGSHEWLEEYHTRSICQRWRLRFRTLSKNPVISADLLDSGHSFIRAIRDKISTKRSRMVTNDANYTNLIATKSERFH